MFGDEQVYSRLARLVPLAEVGMTSYLYFAVFGLTSKCGNGLLDCARYLNPAFFGASGCWWPWWPGKSQASRPRLPP